MGPDSNSLLANGTTPDERYDPRMPLSDSGLPFDLFDLDDVLRRRPPTPEQGRELGRSREGRPIRGFVFEAEPGLSEEVWNVSLIAGCHADEPVGPAMLDRLVSHLSEITHEQPNHPLIQRFRWRIVPHVNPDGEARNRPWTQSLGEPGLWGREGHRHFDLSTYLHHVVRETPGDDIEFGFPRGVDDIEARPENLAVSDFLRGGFETQGPYSLHASFHGVAFAAGPWFLIDREWIPHSVSMRNELRAQEGDWTFHDIDRAGDKGFSRIDRGFTTRPDSRAMREHFLALGDEEMARRFRPSSMEFVRSLGGEPPGPLTIVSEMPLFLVPGSQYRGEGADLIRPEAVREMQSLAASVDLRDHAAARSARERARRHGIRPMSVGDQMRWQLRFLNAALRCIVSYA